MKHTPGIWQIAEGDGRFIYALNEDGYNRFWCRVEGGKIARATITSDDELVANALLMVSAPDLLEACKRLLVCMKLANWEGDDAAIYAHTAIAKATGE